LERPDAPAIRGQYALPDEIAAATAAVIPIVVAVIGIIGITTITIAVVIAVAIEPVTYAEADRGGRKRISAMAEAAVVAIAAATKPAAPIAAERNPIPPPRKPPP